MAQAPSQDDIDQFVTAARDGDTPAVTGWLDRFGKEYIDAENADGQRALSQAAYYQHTDAALALIDRGADVCWRGNGPGIYSPLICAASQGAPVVARALLELGADVNEALPGCGLTSLHYAVMNGHADIARMLLAYGADINAKSGTGWDVRMPLHEIYAERGKPGSEAVRQWKESDRDAWFQAQGAYDPGAWKSIRARLAQREFEREAQFLTEGLAKPMRLSPKITFKANGAASCP